VFAVRSVLHQAAVAIQSTGWHCTGPSGFRSASAFRSTSAFRSAGLGGVRLEGAGTPLGVHTVVLALHYALHAGGPGPKLRLQARQAGPAPTFCLRFGFGSAEGFGSLYLPPSDSLLTVAMTGTPSLRRLDSLDLILKSPQLCLLSCTSKAPSPTGS